MGDTLNIACNFLCCNCHVRRDVLITLYIHWCVRVYKVAQKSCDIRRLNMLLLMSTDRRSRYSDSPRLKSRWGRDFPHPSRPAMGFIQPPVKWVPIVFRGVKWPGRGTNHPPPSSVEVKENVEIYLYSPSGSLWPVKSCNYLFLPSSYVNFWASLCVCVCMFV